MIDRPHANSEDVIADALDRMRASDTNTQIRILAERIGQVASDTAVHAERDGAMSDKFDKMERNFEKIEHKFDVLEDKVTNIQGMVESIDNKWKGGVAVIMIAGTVLGAVTAFWDKISKWFSHA